MHEVAIAEPVATENLVARLGRQPTAPELAAEMGIDLDHLLEAHDALHARNVRWFDSRGSDGRSLGDEVGWEDRQYASAEERVAVCEALDALDQPARELLHRYFFEERSQSEIAADLGVSQMQVSRLLASILRRLRVRVGPR